MRRSGSKVLVHCQMGISRSAAICIAYVMRVERVTLDVAYDFVKSRRTLIAPNLNFMRQLSEFERTLSFDGQPDETSLALTGAASGESAHQTPSLHCVASESGKNESQEERPVRRFDSRALRQSMSELSLGPPRSAGINANRIGRRQIFGRKSLHRPTVLVDSETPPLASSATAVTPSRFISHRFKAEPLSAAGPDSARRHLNRGTSQPVSPLLGLLRTSSCSVQLSPFNIARDRALSSIDRGCPVFNFSLSPSSGYATPTA